MASFDGLDRSTEIPFDNVQSQESALNTAMASFLTRQRTTWDTSNIVSGHTLAASNVQGAGLFRDDQIPWRTQWDTSNIVSGHTLAASNVQGAGLFRDDQIPWRTQWDTSNIVSGETLTPANVQGEGVFRKDQIPWSGAPGDVMADIVAPYVASGTIRVPGSNVYGPLGDPTATLDVSHLTGGLIDASHLPAAPTKMFLVDLTTSNASVNETLFASTIYTCNIYASNLFSSQTITTIPWQNITFDGPPNIVGGLDTTQTSYVGITTTTTSTYSNAEIQFSYGGSYYVMPGGGSTTSNVYSGAGPQNMAGNTLTGTCELLTNVGVSGRNVIGEILYTSLPSFIQPQITFDVTRTSNTTNTTTNNTVTSVIQSELERIDSTMTDAQILASFNSQTAFNEIQVLPVHKMITTVTETSNMRFSLGGFSNLTSDYVTANFNMHTSNLTAAGYGAFNSLNVTGGITAANFTASGTIQAGTIRTSGGVDLATVAATAATAESLGIAGTTLGALGAALGGLGMMSSSAGSAIGGALGSLLGFTASAADSTAGTGRTTAQIVDQLSKNGDLSGAISKIIAQKLGDPSQATTLLNAMVKELNKSGNKPAQEAFKVALENVAKAAGMQVNTAALPVADAAVDAAAKSAADAAAKIAERAARQARLANYEAVYDGEIQPLFPVELVIL